MIFRFKKLSYTSLLYDANVEHQIGSKVFGHSDIETIYEVNTHLIKHKTK
jgi:hypothetical protein